MRAASIAATVQQLCDYLWLDDTARTHAGAPVKHECSEDGHDGHTVHRCACGRLSSADA